MNRATSFIVYAIVGRFRGPEQLGQLALAITLLLFFNRLVMLGLQTLTTREVAKDRSKTGSYLVNGSAIIAASSFVAYFVAYAFVVVMDYSATTSRTILILLLGLGAYSISKVTESLLLAWHKASYIAYVNVPVNIVQTAIAFVLLQRGYSVDVVAISFVGAYFSFAIIQGLVVARMAGPISIRIDLAAARGMVKMGRTFLGIQAMTALRASTYIVLISIFFGETEVGVYAAARQLLVPLGLITSSVGLGLFPTMVQRHAAGVESLKRLTGRIVEVMVAIVLPAVAGLVVLGEPILELIYGDESFDQSGQVLRILAWTGLGEGVIAVLGQALWAAGREKKTLRIAVVNAAIRLGGGLALIPAFGAVGAAVSAVIVSAINMAQHYRPVVRLFGSFPLARYHWRPAAATGAMVVGLLLVTGEYVAVRILIGTLVYACTLATVLVVSEGGWSRFRVHWL